MINSWKTTLIGMLTGVGYLFLSAMQSGVKPRDAALAAGVAVLGALAKDHSAPSQ